VRVYSTLAAKADTLAVRIASADARYYIVRGLPHPFRPLDTGEEIAPAMFRLVCAKKILVSGTTP
jgi:hypothetical protein